MISDSVIHTSWRQTVFSLTKILEQLLCLSKRLYFHMNKTMRILFYCTSTELVWSFFMPMFGFCFVKKWSPRTELSLLKHLTGWLLSHRWTQHPVQQTDCTGCCTAPAQLLWLNPLHTEFQFLLLVPELRLTTLSVSILRDDVWMTHLLQTRSTHL